MTASRNGWFERFDRLSLRERLLLGLTAVVLLLFLWWMLVYESLVPKTRSLQQSNQRQASELQALVAARDGIRKRLDRGVHHEQQARVEQLRKQLQLLRQQLDEGTESLVAPQQMFELMRGMIDAAPRLKLLQLRRLAVEPLFRPEQGTETAEPVQEPDGPANPAMDEDEETLQEQPALYRHVMQVRLQGRYADILDWLQQLEQLPWQLMWNRVELTAREYPVIEVELKLSTVSSSRAWVGL